MRESWQVWYMVLNFLRQVGAISWNLSIAPGMLLLFYYSQMVLLSLKIIHTQHGKGHGLVFIVLDMVCLEAFVSYQSMTAIQIQFSILNTDINIYRGKRRLSRVIFPLQYGVAWPSGLRCWFKAPVSLEVGFESHCCQ